MIQRRSSFQRIFFAGLACALFFAGTNAHAASTTTLFFDGFESNNFSAWNAPVGSNFSLSGGTCRMGPDTNVVAAKITGAGTPHGQVIQVATSTAGFENIKVSFCFKWDVLESGESAVIEYTTDGSTWNVLKTIDNTTVDHMMYAADNTEIATSNGVGQIPTPFSVTLDELESHGIMLPADAANKAAFAFRIREQLGDGDDYIWIDDIRVTGTALASVPPPPPANLILNSGLETPSANPALPQNWFKGGWGANVRVHTYPVAGYEGSSAARVEITSYTNGDAKWYFSDILVTAGKTYTFSDWYMSNATSYVALRYKMADGSFTYVDLAPVGPAATWQNFKRDFTVPANAVSATVFHIINKVGYLVTDNYSVAPRESVIPFTEGMVSLSFDDGYLSVYQNAIPILDAAGLKSTQYIISGAMDLPDRAHLSDVLAMQANGHDIAGHTKTHPDLTGLSSANLQTEVGGSRRDLVLAGITPVDNFAYPEGEYTTGVQDVVRASGFLGSRSVDRGYNAKNTDRYALKIEPVVSTTTSAEIKGQIDEAMSSKQWLILMFHQVDHSGAQYGSTPELLQEIVDYLKLKNTSVVTVSQGLSLMDPGAPIVPDTAAPTITLNGSASIDIPVNTSYFDAGATAVDNIDGDLTASLVAGGDTVNSAVPGTYHVRYNISDLAGNPAIEKVRTVNVIAAGPTSNLIQNPSLEIQSATPGLPQNWFKGGWGANVRTLTYPAPGRDGSSAVRTEITSFTTGDAKWYFSDVPVTPGRSYTFSSWYTSNIPSYIGLRYTMNGGTFTYASLATVAASPSDWQNTSAEFTVPANAQSVTVFHVIRQVGYLATDDLSLLLNEPLPPISNPITNPSVETSSPAEATLPLGWRTGRWGTNTAVFTYPAPGITGSKAIKIDITAYTSGDAKWYFDEIIVDPSIVYTFSDRYLSTVTTEPTVRYTLSDGGYQYVTLASLPPSPIAQQYSVSFTPPPTAVGMTVFHVIAGVGSLTTDDFSITH